MSTSDSTKPQRNLWGGDYQSYIARKRIEKGWDYSTVNNASLKPQPNIFTRLYQRIAWVGNALVYNQVDWLIRYGYKHQIEASDFPPVQNNDSSDYLSGAILREWQKEQSKPSPSLWKAIVRVFGWQYSFSIVAAVGDLILRLLQATAFHALINWFEVPGASPASGYLYATAVFAIVLLDTFLRHFLFFISMRTGFQLRVGLISTIYRKALKLSLGHTASTGVIVNLVSNDVQRFEDAAPFAYFIFLAPIEAIVVGIYLYFYIGPAAWVGLAALLLIIPLQSMFARVFATVRRSVVQVRDERIRNTSDILFGMDVVKVYAWEQPFAQKLTGLREEEIKEIRKANVMKAANDGLFFSTPAAIGLCTWLTYWALGNQLNPDNVFMASLLFQMVRLTMSNSFPKAVQFISEARVSLRRIQEFLSIPEMDTVRQLSSQSEMEQVKMNGMSNVTSNLPLNGDAKMLHPTDALPSSNYTPSQPSKNQILISVQDGTFAWDIKAARDILQGSNKTKISPTGTWLPWKTNKTLDPLKTVIDDRGIALSLRDTDESGLKVLLKDISLSVKRGELTCIVGPVGSGKSSLLLGILGEMLMTKGQVLWSTDKIAYCPQQPWVIAGTVQDNITFGKPYNQSRFTETVEACSLVRDLELFPEGQHSLCGERGITMSGGQKARVSLGRAVYHEADIYLLDDPLSAVDTAVGRHLFEKCILGTLRDDRNAGVVLVTHQLQFVKRADNIIVLNPDGTISCQGSWSDIVQAAQRLKDENQRIQAEAFEQLSNSMAIPISNDDLAPGETLKAPIKQSTPTSSRPASSHVGNFLEVLVEFDKSVDVGMDISVDDVVQDVSPSVQVEQPTEKKKEFTKEEGAVGSVSWKVYWTYFRAGGGIFILSLLLLLMILGQVLLVLSDWWLSQWTNMTYPIPQSYSQNAMIYGILCAALLVASIVRAEAFYSVCIRASVSLSEKMLDSVFASPMSFFQTNPHGRLLNRFSSDLSRMDELLPMTLFDFLQCAFMIIGIIILACILVPWILIAVPFLVFIFFMLRKIYVTTSRQIKRLESISRSPVLSQVPASLEGLAVIRAFGAQQDFVKEFVELQDVNTSQYYAFMCSSRWLGIRLDSLAGIFLGISAYVCVALGSSVAPGTVGLLLSYLNSLLGLNQWAVRQSSEVENLMVATERVLEYTNLPSEPPRYTDVKPGKEWPPEGRLEFKDMSLTYPVTGQTVLKNLKFEVPPGSKVGIVGRTGAGKSSLLSALFRLVEPSPVGSVKIDGVETSGLGLFDLRSRLGIIPQTATLYQGTLRFNLDPFNEYSDLDIWMALETAQLKQKVEMMPDKLNSPVTDQGGNWSVGERQLLCLARAVLKKSRIMVLDEASANVDLRTDRLIQSAIRDELGPFSNATILTIAHRLQTVIDYDFILVLSAGQVVEYGRPYDLLKKDGWFSSMVHEMGPEAEGMLKQVAKEKEIERREALGMTMDTLKSDRGESLRSTELKVTGDGHFRRASEAALQLLVSFPSPSTQSMQSLRSGTLESDALLSLPRRPSRQGLSPEEEAQLDFYLSQRRQSRAEGEAMGLENARNL